MKVVRIAPASECDDPRLVPSPAKRGRAWVGAANVTRVGFDHAAREGKK
jgi:hypothetical protein